MDLLYDSNVVVGISLVLFFAILFYFGVHRKVVGGLDARAERIRGELDEARRLREEAQGTFAEFERKQRDVQAQAEEIVEHAQREAREAAERAKADLAATIERRLKAADEQIALAEANAVKEVRDRAAEIAVAAAAEVLRNRLGEDQASGMTDRSIEEVARRLH